MNFEHTDIEGSENHAEKNVVTEQQIFEVVRNTIAKAVREGPSTVTLDSKIIEDLGVEPIHRLKIYAGICAGLNIDIPFEGMIPNIAIDTSMTIRTIVENLKNHKEIILTEEEDI